MSYSFEEMGRKTVGRAAGAVPLIAMMICGPAMADESVKPEPPGDWNQDPFRLQYECRVSASQGMREMPLISEPVPEGKGFVVEHVLGQVMTRDGGPIGIPRFRLEISEGQTNWTYATGIAAVTAYERDYAAFNPSVDLFFETTPYVSTAMSGGRLAFNIGWCGVTLLGYLEDL